MRYTYPAVVHEESDGAWLEFPDLLGCQTFGDTVDELLINAEQAMECHIVEALEHGDKLNKPSDIKAIQCDDNSFATLVSVDVDLAKNTRSVKKTLTIPSWMNDKAMSVGINFSKVLQEALLAKFA